MFLPDVNFWLALAFEKHVHHTTALSWFNQRSEAACLFCRMTQQGFLRLATNPKAFGDETVSMVQAWQMYDGYLNDPRVIFSQEPENLESHWRGFTQTESFTPKIWNDAFLAGFAEAGVHELVTFDRGFSRYKNLKATILS